MNRIIAATAALAATLALVGSIPASATAPSLPTVKPAKIQLVWSGSTKMSCLTMERTDDGRPGRRTETVVQVFKYKNAATRQWQTVWVAEDGLQFTVVPVPQNQPWGCIPNKVNVETPAGWSK